MEPEQSILFPSVFDFPNKRSSILIDDEGENQILTREDYLSGKGSPTGTEVARHYGISNRTLFAYLLFMSFRELPGNIRLLRRAFNTGLSIPVLASLNASLVYGKDFPAYNSPFPLVDPYKMRDMVVNYDPSLIDNVYEDYTDYSTPALLMGQCFVNQRADGYRKVVARIRDGGYWDRTYAIPGGRAKKFFYDYAPLREVFEEMPGLRELIWSLKLLVKLTTLSTLDASVNKRVDGGLEQRAFLSHMCEIDVLLNPFQRRKYRKEDYTRGDQDGRWEILNVTGPNDHHIRQSIGMRAALISSLNYPIFADPTEGSEWRPPRSNVYGFHVQKWRNYKPPFNLDA